MLEPAIKYKTQLEQLQYETWFNDKYKYWVAGCYNDAIKLEDSTWREHQFVSVVDGVPIGFIDYGVDRSNNRAYGLCAINFSDNKLVFGKDLIQCVRDVFEKFKFRKLSFEVFIGNPIEKTYDRLIDKIGGRIVGVEKEHTMLQDGEFYDLKLYEVLAKDYFNAINKRG